MTDRQTINRQNANSGFNDWSCPWCDFEGTGSDRWRHIRDEHE